MPPERSCAIFMDRVRACKGEVLAASREKMRKLGRPSDEIERFMASAESQLDQMSKRECRAEDLRSPDALEHLDEDLACYSLDCRDLGACLAERLGPRTATAARDTGLRQAVDGDDLARLLATAGIEKGDIDRAVAEVERLLLIPLPSGTQYRIQERSEGRLRLVELDGARSTSGVLGVYHVEFRACGAMRSWANVPQSHSRLAASPHGIVVITVRDPTPGQVIVDGRTIGEVVDKDRNGRRLSVPQSFVREIAPGAHTLALKSRSGSQTDVTFDVAAGQVSRVEISAR